MAKYDDEFKLKIVKAFLNGEKKSWRGFAREWGLPDSHSLKYWVRNYEAYGEEGLKTRKKPHQYSRQFKLDVIHYYQISGESYLDVAVKFGISNPGTVTQWHHKLLEEGLVGLSKSKERPFVSKKPKKQIEDKDSEVEDLKRENELLRAQLAFIKKLRASGNSIPSRLLKQKSESSKNSDKPSD